MHMLFRFKSIGTNCFIGLRSSINKPRYLELGNDVRIGNDLRVSFYDEFAQVKMNPYLQLGNRTYIGNHFTALCADKIIIEDDVLIASYVMITTENHGMDPENELVYGKQPLMTKPVVIESGAWIGEKVSIMPGVTIGKKAIIGTNSVVTRSVPPYSIAVGNPARVIKIYDFVEKKWTNT